MKFMSKIGLVVCMLSLIAASVQAAAPTNWKGQKRPSNTYALDLAGSAPSAAQVAANNLKCGDMIVDTSENSLYILMNESGPVFTKFLVTGGISVPEGTVADSTILSADIKDGELVNADINASAGIVVSKFDASTGSGTGTAAAAYSSDTFPQVHATLITITNCVLTATDGSDEGESKQIYDFPEGAVCVLGARANLSVLTTAGATSSYYVAVGTVAAADDSDLTSTEADIIPKTTLTGTGTLVTNDCHAILASAAIFDGTTTAKDLFLNLAIDDDNMDANPTNTITGTVTVYWVGLGDH